MTLVYSCLSVIFFFKQKTAYEMRISDWSSDVCSSDLIALPAGDAILYPSSSLHRVEPVTRGARLASFFWIQSLVRDNGQRQMLFEMDTAIQKLTLDGADDNAVLQLTCVYRSEEHTSELQSLMRISYAVFCLKKKNNTKTKPTTKQTS